MKDLLKYGAIVAAFVIVGNWQAVAAYFTPAIDYSAAENGEVVLYATAWCGYCRKTRTLLEAYGIEYTEFDIEKSAAGKRRFDQLGGRGVPVVTVGSQVIHGYNPGALKNALSNPQ